MSILYTAKAKTTGGRDGHVESTDGMLKMDLAIPKEMGGAGGKVNPEILFAAGYSACFDSAVRHVARMQKITIPESSVEADVSVSSIPSGGFLLSAVLRVSLPGMDRAEAKKLADAAHQVCPYSIATRGNMDVKIDIA